MSDVLGNSKAIAQNLTNARTCALVLGAVLVASILLPIPGADGKILGLPSICAFYDITGLPCPGCGLTRSFVCFAHGHILNAFRWNLFGPPLWVAFALLLVRACLTLVYKRNVLVISPTVVNRVSIAALSSFLLFGVGRIIWLTVEHRKF